MDKRELFFKAYDEIGEALKEYDFIPADYSRGLWKKSLDGIMKSRIYFGPMGQFRRESPDPPVIHPYFEIYSTQLGEWIKSQIRIERYSLPDQVYAYPKYHWKRWRWNLGDDYDQAVKEIIGEIKLRILPIVEIFKDTDTALDFLKNNRTRFNPDLPKTLGMLEFMLCFGTKDNVTSYIGNFFEDKDLPGLHDKISSLYDELSKSGKLLQMSGKLEKYPFSSGV